MICQNFFYNLSSIRDFFSAKDTDIANELQYWHVSVRKIETKISDIPGMKKESLVGFFHGVRYGDTSLSDVC